MDFLIERALKEDKVEEDISSSFYEERRRAIIISKTKDAILCGIDIVKRVFTKVDTSIQFDKLKEDGDILPKGEVVARIYGRAKSILRAERTALNFLQRLSGIATTSRLYADRVKDYDVIVVDTRKTTPGYRKIEKYCVRCGGVKNHRMDLSEMIMIKDNHIKCAGGIKEALERVFSIDPEIPVEVEVKNLKEFMIALQFPVDVIMCDNFSPSELKKAVDKAKGRVLIEASGGITLNNIEEYARTGVNVISTGSITHSFKSSDFSLEII